MFSGPLNECTSWTNRLWASLSAFSGTVEQSVLPCRLKVEICETMQEFVQQKKQTRENTINRPQHIVNIVKLKTKLLKTCPCGLSWTQLLWLLFFYAGEWTDVFLRVQRGSLWERQDACSYCSAPQTQSKSGRLHLSVISIAAALVLRLSLSVKLPIMEKPPSISTFIHSPFLRIFLDKMIHPLWQII